MAASMKFEKMLKFCRFLPVAPSSRLTTCRQLHISQRLCQSTTSEPKFLPRGEGRAIAYRYLEGKEPGIIFFPGFQSHMQGTKAMALEGYCREKNIAFLRFDYQGCGESKGNIYDMTFSDWQCDAKAALDQLTAGPQIFVGSSMGAWMMLLTALERPHRVHSLVGVASSVDFPDWGMDRWPQQIQDSMQKEGVAVHETDHHTFVLTKKWFEDAKNHRLLDRESLPITCPVRLLHGMQDESVPYDLSIKIAEKLWTRDVEVLLRKGSDHRFSQPDDIQLLFEILDYLVYGAQEARKLALTSWQAFSVYAKPRQALSMIANGQKIKETI